MNRGLLVQTAPETTAPMQTTRAAFPRQPDEHRELRSMGLAQGLEPDDNRFNWRVWVDLFIYWADQQPPDQSRHIPDDWKLTRSRIMELNRYPETLVVLLIALFSSFVLTDPPLSVEDAVVYFNQYNNIEFSNPFFFYADYVALYPEISAFVSSLFPLWTQSLLYVVFSFFVSLYFFYEFDVFLRRHTRFFSQRLCALLVIAFLLARLTSSSNVFGNLTYCIWVLLPGFLFHLLNMESAKKFSITRFIISALAVLSHPAAIITFPVTLYFFGKFRGDFSRSIVALILAVLTLVSFFLLVRSDSAMSQFDLRKFVEQFYVVFVREQKLGSHLFLICFSFLVCAFVASLFNFKLRGASPQRDMVIILCYFGISTSVSYLVSSRFYWYDVFPGRYAIPAVIGAATIALCWIYSIQDLFVGERHQTLYKAAFGALAILTSLALVLSAHPVRVVENQLAMYRFLRDSEKFRRGCTEGASALRVDRWSPVVLCHPVTVEDQSRTYDITDFVNVVDYSSTVTPTPSGEIRRVEQQSERPTEKPRIYVGDRWGLR